jgi:hypothetical protein
MELVNADNANMGGCFVKIEAEAVQGAQGVDGCSEALEGLGHAKAGPRTGCSPSKSNEWGEEDPGS